MYSAVKTDNNQLRLPKLNSLLFQILSFKKLENNVIYQSVSARSLNKQQLLDCAQPSDQKRRIPNWRQPSDLYSMHKLGEFIQ